MDFRPNPLLYGANEDFLSSFKMVVTLRDAVDRDALARAVEAAMVRYPYFSVYPKTNGNELWLVHNRRPVPVFADGRCAVLGSEESNGHLLIFGCEGERLFLNASHYLADGMGIAPLFKTVLYLYVAARYGTEGLCAERISMPDDPVAGEEYAYPFADVAAETEDTLCMPKASNGVYALDADAFDGEGLYAYHLHVPQKAMMAKAHPSDGSPVSFLSVLLYRALCDQDPTLRQPIVVHVQHQYRATLRTPLCRHSMVNYIPVVLPPTLKERNVEWQNTVMRGQILLGSEAEADRYAIGRMLSAFPSDKDASLAEKKRAMRQYTEESILGKTFGISYVGKMDWCGLERHVSDMHVYIGEKHTKNMLLLEVLTVGEDFSINLMQSGRGRRYVDALIAQLESFDIPVRLVGEERYTLCDTQIP